LTHHWIEFALASALLGLIPGPGVMSICGYALSSGRRTALASVAGMALGNLLAMSLSLAGAGALLAASAVAFTALKWAGALYLIGLGVLTLTRAERRPQSAPAAIGARGAFRSNLLLGTFHPKTLVFFVAFAPQFIDPRATYATQAGLLVATFVIIVAGTDTLYALLAARASALLRRPATSLWMRRAGGGVLIAAGAATASAGP